LSEKITEVKDVKVRNTQYILFAAGLGSRQKSGDTLFISPPVEIFLKEYVCPIGGTFFDEL
jgi:hypothetical protein